MFLGFSYTEHPGSLGQSTINLPEVDDWDPDSAENHVAVVHCHSAERENQAWQTLVRLVSSKASELLLEPVLFHTFIDATEKELVLYYSAKGDYLQRSGENPKAWSISDASEQEQSFLHLPAKGQVGSFGQAFLLVCQISEKTRKELLHKLYI